MNDRIFSRTELLFGEESMEKLKNSSVIVFGLGGVGGHTAEALARSGIGRIGIVDKDVFDITNLNRQLFATVETLGQNKTDAVEERLKSINPDLIIEKYNMFYLPETSEAIKIGEYDYAVDAIDTVSGKIEIIMNAKNEGIPVISSMGTGNKFDPLKLTVTDIYKTEVCPLARIMRRELKKRGIESLKVVYSTEKPYERTDKSVTASNAFVPATAGIIIASQVVYDLIEKLG